ncbi:hypothetical protein, partial [Vibrio vulnificus]
MNSSDNNSFTLHNTLRVPSIFHNILSVHTLTTSNPVCVKFFANHFLVKELETGKVLCQGENKDGVYYL